MEAPPPQALRRQAWFLAPPNTLSVSKKKKKKTKRRSKKRQSKEAALAECEIKQVINSPSKASTGNAVIFHSSKIIKKNRFRKCLSLMKMILISCNPRETN